MKCQFCETFLDKRCIPTLIERQYSQGQKQNGVMESNVCFANGKSIVKFLTLIFCQYVSVEIILILGN